MSYVLIVDDDPDMVAVLRVVLEAAGYRCQCAENGETALALARQEKPALVLLDMMMPIVNGWECATELRRIYDRSLPIVIVTAAEHAEAWRAEVDADAAISKPFDVHRLLGIVAKYAGPPRAGTTLEPT